MTGRLQGHPGFSLANISWSMETKTQFFIGREDVHACAAWLHFWEQRRIYCQTFSLWGKICSQKHSSPFQNICHLWESLFLFSHPNGSCESEDMIHARWREDTLWGDEFPITSERVSGCSLTLFYRVVLTVPFWDAVWGFLSTLLVLVCLFVGCFHWGRKEMASMQEQK